MSFPKPNLAVDLALITVMDGHLCCLLMNRQDAVEVGGDWALPGGFVHIDETIEQTALRVLQQKAGMETAYLEQLFTYGNLNRDPRERVVSVSHFALVPAKNLAKAVRGKNQLALARIIVNWDGETGGAASAFSEKLGTLNLAFDHADMLGDVVKRLRGKLNYSDIALELLPEFFTLRQAQEIYEAILGHKLTKPAFRRKLTDRKTIEPTGQRETASAFRPAELYTRI
ncbi:MAG: NUDIX hydrolase [Rhodobacteraceae bacterium]|nr:NUDIX hydrolase [Paracoccaceae bacterium]